MKRLSFIPVLLLSCALMADDTPPYTVQDPAIQYNFDEIFYTMDTHRHNQDGSSRLFDVIPDSGSTYNVGSATIPWAAVTADTGTFKTNLILPNLTSSQMSIVTPSTTGILMYNSTDKDLYVSTGQTFNAWRNVRTGGGL